MTPLPAEHRNPGIVPYLILSLAPLCWAANIVLARGVAGMIPPAAFAFYRWLLAAALILPFARRRLATDRERLSRGWKQLLLLSVLGISSFNALLYTARSGRKEVGSVTSATWSPTCKRNIALALVDTAHSALGTTLWADIYLNRELVWERRMVPARVVERPFYAPARRRATPPADF